MSIISMTCLLHLAVVCRVTAGVDPQRYCRETRAREDKNDESCGFENVTKCFCLKMQKVGLARAQIGLIGLTCYMMG
jgi:hypothetical protein